MKTVKVFLSHGENEYLLYKELKEKKDKFIKENQEIFEINGTKNLTFSEIYEIIYSGSFFANKTNVIINSIGEGNAFFPFVEKLIDYIPKIQSDNCEIHIYHRGKISKNSRIYKVINKYGLIKEYSNPEDHEILSVIKKSLPIEDKAAELLFLYTHGDLFTLKNEIKKLSCLITENYVIKETDVEKYCFKVVADSEIWKFSKLFLDYLINKNTENKVKLIDELELLIKNNTPTMQILYSICSYVLNFIKMKRLIKKGKTFRECLSLGYYFIKEYFNKADSVEETLLYATNSKLLEYEFEVKTGQIDEINGLRKLILSF